MIKNEIEKIALDEAEAKDLLKGYGIPVVNEMVARTVDEVKKMVAQVGYPLVLKGLGKKLLHKTELGIVHVKIADEETLINAAGDIEKKAGDKLEGFLLQPFVSGKRELVAGIIRDPQFGPMVMLGLGGIFTEAFNDSAFRMAPLSENDAIDMIEELRSKKMLGSFRGDSPVNKSQIVNTLTGLSKLASDMPEVSEVDINPIIIDSNGEICAVDALVIKSNAPAKSTYTNVGPYDLKTIMAPKSIAFIGASTQIGKWGQLLPTVTIANKFIGDIYLVNPKGGDFFGQKIYTSLEEIPGDVDVAVITIPAQHVVGLIPSMTAKGIKNAVVISSGYSEIGEEGRKLETELVVAMKAAGITFIGPNLMGFLNPNLNLNVSIYGRQNTTGSLGVISQSGNLALLFTILCNLNNIGISSMCTNGNEAMVGTEDLIEYFYQDERTKVIAVHIERINDGRRFYSTMKKVSAKKPILLLKGGQSSKGSMAAASHTGGMRTDAKVFNSVCKQAGIMQVESYLELLDASAMFSYLPIPKGKRVAIMTMGGGAGVIISDLCEKYGLEIPELSEELIEEFNKLFPPFWSHANPVDMLNDADKTVPLKVMEALARWDGCDVIIHNALVGQQTDLSQSVFECLQAIDENLPAESIEEINRSKANMENKLHNTILELMKKYGKPIVGVGGWLLSSESNIVYQKDENSGLGSLSYMTPERAVSSISYMCKYADIKKKKEQ